MDAYDEIDPSEYFPANARSPPLAAKDGGNYVWS
jgi:hypothetical protein